MACMSASSQLPAARTGFIVSIRLFSSTVNTTLTSQTARQRAPLTFRTNRRRKPPSFTSCAIQSTPLQAEDVLRTVGVRSGLADSQLESLLHLADLLLEVNKQYNLTAIRSREAVLLKHIVNALSLLQAFDNENPQSIIDVGTGAGFPGIVLAVARPNWHVTLLDSARKKTKFHDLVKTELKLDNISSVWARAEEAGQDQEHREKYNIAVARSVAEMRVLAELCLPLVTIDGCFMAQKSVDESQAEVTKSLMSIKILGGRLESVAPAWQETWMQEQADNDESGRRKKSLVVVRKMSPTPTKYPRQSGTPKKSPL